MMKRVCLWVLIVSLVFWSVSAAEQLSRRVW